MSLPTFGFVSLHQQPLADGIAAEAQWAAQVAERGRAQAQGAGLGLAIAKAIATGTGSSLELISPREGREDGFEARLRIGRLA